MSGKHEIDRQYRLVTPWRRSHGRRVFYSEHRTDAHGHRHSVRFANDEIRSAMPVAVRFVCPPRRRATRLSEHADEFHLVLYRRRLDMPYSRFLRGLAIHYDHRYSVREAALEDGSPRSDSFRERDRRSSIPFPIRHVKELTTRIVSPCRRLV